jgi:hypothetical protein
VSFSRHYLIMEGFIPDPGIKNAVFQSGAGSFPVTYLKKRRALFLLDESRPGQGTRVSGHMV